MNKNTIVIADRLIRKLREQSPDYNRSRSRLSYKTQPNPMHSRSTMVSDQKTGITKNTTSNNDNSDISISMQQVVNSVKLSKPTAVKTRFITVKKPTTSKSKSATRRKRSNPSKMENPAPDFQNYTQMKHKRHETILSEPESRNQTLIL